MSLGVFLFLKCETKELTIIVKAVKHSKTEIVTLNANGENLKKKTEITKSAVPKINNPKINLSKFFI